MKLAASTQQRKLMESTTHPDPAREEIEAAYADYLARLEGGEPADFEGLVRRFPGREEELRSLHRGCTSLRSELARIAGELGSGGNGLGEGRAVAGFRLVRLIGRGGMGEVWEAEEPALSRRVALKLLLPERLTERGIRFFEREARAAGRIRHPGIVTVYAAGRSRGIFWLAQELVEGGRTLASYLAEAREADRLPGDYHRRIARIFRDLARAVDAAHEAGVVHRDLKPRNVLLDGDDRPRVVDFGLARIADEASLSRSGDVVGTYSYMSPEQVSAKRGEVGPWSDVFSLGVVLYEALSLERPFEAETTTALATRILFHDPPDPDRVRGDVPHELALICKKALEKSPTRRFRSMTELADELDRYLERKPIRTRPVGPLGRAERWARRNPAACAVAGFVAVALLAVGFFARESVLAREARDEVRKSNLLAQAQVAGATGNLELARGYVDEAQALDPQDVLGHFILAGISMQMGQLEEAQDEIARAFAKGFRVDGGEGETALATSARGLHLLAEGGRRYGEAEALLREARAKDPLLSPVSYALYQARLAEGDVAGARAALAELEEVPLAKSMATLVSALLLELDDDPREALRVLDALEPEVRKDLRAERVVGRLRLQADDYAGAIEALRTAVEHAPRDEASWSNLAMALYLGAAHTPATMDEIEACCERALELNDAQDEARVTLGALALERLERALPGIGGPPGAGWDELDRRIEELRASDPSHPGVDELSSQRTALAAEQLDLAGDTDGAAVLYADALEQDPENVRARVILGQTLVEADAPHEGLVELERALESYERAAAGGRRGNLASWRPSVGPRWPRVWYQAAQAWRFGAAVRAGDRAAAEDARDAVEAELAATGTYPPDELISYVEFLATSPIEELRDCARAHELLEQHDLRRRYERIPAGIETLRKIDAACP